MGLVFLDPVIKTVRTPCLGEEYYGYRLTEIIELQTTRAYCIHDRSVVNDLHGYTQFTSTDDKVRMRGGSIPMDGINELCSGKRKKRFKHLPVRITDNQETHVHLVCILQDTVTIRLDHFAVGYNN